MPTQCPLHSSSHLNLHTRPWGKLASLCKPIKSLESNQVIWVGWGAELPALVDKGFCVVRTAVVLFWEWGWGAGGAGEAPEGAGSAGVLSCGVRAWAKWKTTPALLRVHGLQFWGHSQSRSLWVCEATHAVNFASFCWWSSLNRS